LELRARADYELGEVTLARETIGRHLADAERFLARCANTVEEASARGPDEPDPPPDL
jgi:hypothetical protein